MTAADHLSEKQHVKDVRPFRVFRTIQKNHYLLLTLLWIFITLIVNPIGEFPLNDDWAYCKDVQLFVTSGHLQLVDWSAMTLVSQLFLGFFFCKIFGFSFTLLRILTSVVGSIGVITTYRIINEYTRNGKLALFVSVLIALNPLFFSLSATFMTDVYFYTFSILSVFFFSRSIDSDKLLHILIATVFAIVATLTRQIGIVIPVAFACIFFYRSTAFSLKAFLPLVFTAAALCLFNYWLSFSFKNQTSYFSATTVLSSSAAGILPHTFYRIGTSGMMLGLFLFPLLLFLLPYYPINLRDRKNKLSLFFTAVFIIPLLRAWENIPLGNIFYNLGLGPKLLKDAAILQINNDPALSNFALISVKVICLAGGILLFYYIFCNIFNFNNAAGKNFSYRTQKLKLFSFIIVLLFFGTFVIPNFFFDRYLIQLLLPLIIIILPAELKINLKSKLNFMAASFLLLYAFLTVGLTHDYLSWNRARWKAADYLVNDLQKSPHVIDGGFEFNAWYQTAPIENGQAKSWWFVDKDDYILTFGMLPGYTISKTVPYTQLIPLKEKCIYILYKTPGKNHDENKN